MFTGIVSEIGILADLEKKEGALRYSVSFSPEWGKGLIPGASVAINGICQTVVHVEIDSAVFEATHETLRCTNISHWKKGDRLNLERSLSFGSECGGHLMSGHVMGVAELVSTREAPLGRDFILKIPSPLIEYFFPKGFISLNGVSLTVGTIDLLASTLECYLIPETLERTNLSSKVPGALLNLEPDETTKAVVETVRRMIKTGSLLRP